MIDRIVRCIVWAGWLALLLAVLSTLFHAVHAAQIDVTAYGAKPNDSADDTSGLQKAWDACKHGDAWYAPPGFYRFTTKLSLIADGRSVDVSARFADLRWYGTAAGPVVVYGGKTLRMIGSRFDGLTIDNMAAKRWDVDNTGIVLQNLSDFDVRLGRVLKFRQGIVLSGVVAYGSLRFTVAGNKYMLVSDRSAPGAWHNRITFDNCRFAGCGALTGTAPYDAATMIFLPRFPNDPGGWSFRDCSFEDNNGSKVALLEGHDIVYSVFDGCWFESGGGRMQCKVDPDSSRLRRVVVRGGVPLGVDWDPRIFVEQ